MSPIGENKIKMCWLFILNLFCCRFLKKVRNKHTELFANDLLKQTLKNQYFARLLQQILDRYCCILVCYMQLAKLNEIFFLTKKLALFMWYTAVPNHFYVSRAVFRVFYQDQVDLISVLKTIKH